jgi:hypothetical protein
MVQGRIPGRQPELPPAPEYVACSPFAAFPALVSGAPHWLQYFSSGRTIAPQRGHLSRFSMVAFLPGPTQAGCYTHLPHIISFLASKRNALYFDAVLIIWLR